MQGVNGKVPKGELCINDSVIRNILNCKHVGFDERKEFIDSLGLDIVTISTVYSCLKQKIPKSENYLWPDIKKWTQDTSLFTFGIIDGAFELGLRTLGFQEFFGIIQASPSALRDFIKSVEDLNLSLIKKLADEGVDGIILADDIAYQKGLLVSPQILREFFFPSLERQVKVIDKLGIQAFYHSDGNYSKVIADIINVGFGGLHCIDKNSSMDIFDLQQKVGEKLWLWGHLDINDINEAKNKSFLEDLIIKVQKLSYNKRLILGTSSGLFDGMDLNQLKAIYQSI